MAFRAEPPLVDHMPVMLAGVVTVEFCRTFRMACRALGIYVDRPSGPNGRGLAAVAADLGAGGPIEGNRARGSRVEDGRYADIDSAIVVLFAPAAMAAAADDVQARGQVG